MDGVRFPPRFAEGVRRFNAGAFFEAHEAFEDLLDEVEGDARWDLLIALIQVAVGYHKCVAGHEGAARMLHLGSEKLEHFPAVAYGVDVGRLRERAVEDAALLEDGTGLGKRFSDNPPRIVMMRGWQSAP